MGNGMPSMIKLPNRPYAFEEANMNVISEGGPWTLVLSRETCGKKGADIGSLQRYGKISQKERVFGEILVSSGHGDRNKFCEFSAIAWYIMILPNEPQNDICCSESNGMSEW
jgi:hypothetical protein